MYYLNYLNMISRFARTKINASYTSTLNKFNKRFFTSASTNGIIQSLNNEIKKVDDNYSPPDDKDKSTFLNTNKWVLFEEENSRRMALKKSKDEFDITIRYNSMVPEVIDGINILLKLKL